MLVESREPAVEVVRSVICGERVFAAVEQELGPADASCDTADERSKKRMRAKIVFKFVESQHDIGHGLIRARDTNGGDNTAVVGDVASEPESIREGEQIGLASIG